jgi:uncharacterized protein YoxC
MHRFFKLRKYSVEALMLLSLFNLILLVVLVFTISHTYSLLDEISSSQANLNSQLQNSADSQAQNSMWDDISSIKDTVNDNSQRLDDIQSQL